MRGSCLIVLGLALTCGMSGCSTTVSDEVSQREDPNVFNYVAASGARLAIVVEGPETGVHLWSTDLVFGALACPDRPGCVETPIGVFADVDSADPVEVGRFTLVASREGGTTTVAAYSERCADVCYRYTYDEQGLRQLTWYDPADSLSREGSFVAQGAAYKFGQGPE